MFRALSRFLFPPLQPPPAPGAPASAPLPPALDRWLGGLPHYQPLTRRQRRLLVPALALFTSLGLFYMMLERPGAKPAPASWLLPNPGTPNAQAAATPAATGPARCTEGQTQGCVGGRAQVFIVPAPPAGAAPPAAPAPRAP